MLPPHNECGNRNRQWPKRVYTAEQNESAQRNEGQDNGDQDREHDHVHVI